MTVRSRVQGMPGAGAVSWRKNARFARMSHLALLVSVSCLLLFFDLGVRVLATNDETRFPVLARDILAHGHWLLPRLNGAPHLNKPPLHAWLIAFASWPLGSVTQASAAIPSLLAALGVVLATWWIAKWLFGAAVATVAGLVVVTTYGVFTLARVPMPDMTFCAAVTAALAAYAAAEVAGRGGALVAFYLLVGVAVWTKGPPGLLPLAVAIFDVLTTYGRAGLRRLVSTPGLVLLGLLVLPWWLLAAAAGQGGFLREIVITDWLLWYVPAAGDWRALSEPLAQALTILLPWSLALPVALWALSRPTDAARARRLRLIVLWAATVFVAVAVSHQQRMRYYLPLCPPAAVLIAVWWADLRVPRRTMAFGGVWVLVAVGLGVWHVQAAARYNAATELQAVLEALRGCRAPVYAVEVPELVFTFYLERPVAWRATYGDVEASLDEGPAYLIIADRALPASLTSSHLRQVATGRLLRRPLSVFADDRGSCGGPPAVGSDGRPLARRPHAGWAPAGDA